MAPSSFTSQWLNESTKLDKLKTSEALSNVALIEASNERQEALTIAIAMREVLLEDEKTAALITPDRNLARRVSMELQRFNINVDDTGGTPLKNSDAALFLRQISQICFLPFQNSSLASLLKEIQLQDEKYISPQVKNLILEGLEELTEYCRRLDDILMPLVEISQADDEPSLERYFLCLANAAEALSANDQNKSTILSGEGL